VDFACPNLLASYQQGGTTVKYVTIDGGKVGPVQFPRTGLEAARMACGQAACCNGGRMGLKNLAYGTQKISFNGSRLREPGRLRDAAYRLGNRRFGNACEHRVLPST
jgi:hypothetical protein